MKAVLALIAIYVAAFVIATQGGSQNPVQASSPDTAASSKPIDPVKQTDLSSLLEFVGAKEQQQNAASESISQYRERLRASVPGASEDSTHQAFINAAVETYQKELDQQTRVPTRSRSPWSSRSLWAIRCSCTRASPSPISI